MHPGRDGGVQAEATVSFAEPPHRFEWIRVRDVDLGSSLAIHGSRCFTHPDATVGGAWSLHCASKVRLGRKYLSTSAANRADWTPATITLTQICAAPAGLGTLRERLLD